MSTSKYKQFFDQMLKQNASLFKDFSELHQQYQQAPEWNQERFNGVGRQVLSVIRDWERRLCQQTERGGYSRYSGNLAEKFWELVRQEYPKVDYIGMR